MALLLLLPDDAQRRALAEAFADDDAVAGVHAVASAAEAMRLADDGIAVVVADASVFETPAQAAALQERFTPPPDLLVLTADAPAPWVEERYETLPPDAPARLRLAVHRLAETHRLRRALHHERHERQRLAAHAAEAKLDEDRTADRGLVHALRGALNAAIGYTELAAEEVGDTPGVSEAPLRDLAKTVQACRRALALLDPHEETFDMRSAASLEASQERATQDDVEDGDVEPDARDGAVPDGDADDAVPGDVPADPGEPGAPHVAPPSPDGAVLLVDDDADLQALMARFLEAEGFDVLTASNGEEGLALARARRPALVILDVHMPHADGWTLLQTLREDPDLAAIPVVMLTGRGTERTAARALRLGVDDYLIKGDVVGSTLRHAVDGALEKARLRAAVARTQEALERANERLEERVAEQTRQLQDLLAALTVAEQQERHRVAQVLHDHLQQHLMALVMRLGLLRRRAEAGADAPAERDAPPLGEAVGEAEALLREAIGMTRSLAAELSPPLLNESDDVAEIARWLAERSLSLHELRVDVVADAPCPVPRREIRVLVYQLLRELLFNVTKHADTREARVVVACDDAGLRLTVEDDGVGFDADAASGSDSGWGLQTMRGRLHVLGGTLDVASAPGEGTRVHFTLPGSKLRAPSRRRQKSSPTEK